MGLEKKQEHPRESKDRRKVGPVTGVLGPPYYKP